MNRFNKILLLSDMDGTLLNSNGEISIENQNAINYFIENGGIFGVATGRGHRNSLLFLKEIEVNGPCIIYNGCAIYDFKDHKFLKLLELKKTRLKSFIKLCMKEFPRVAIQIYDKDMCYLVSQESMVDLEFMRTHQPCKVCELEEILDIPWIKILFCGSMDELGALNRRMIENKLEDDIGWVFTSEIYLEYLPYGVNKGSALRDIRGLMDSDLKIYAIGDYNNDVEMILAADVGIATGNALELLKSIADMVTVSNDESAIAHVIYNIIK